VSKGKDFVGSIGIDRPPDAVGAAVAAPDMQARRHEMNARGEAASKGAIVAPYSDGPGASEWVLPRHATSPGAILFLHGSGYSKGSPSSHRPLVARIVAATGMPALVPDYRLTPEHRFPAPVEDALNAYGHLLGTYSARSVVVIGDSAGGGLAMATLLAARDMELPLPGAIVTMSAWTDLTVSGRERADVEDPRVTPSMLRAAADLYLDGADARHPYASPLFGDYTGFPPILMQVGGREIMIEDTIRLAENARCAGAAVTQTVYPGMAHVFQLNQPDEPSSEDAIFEMTMFIERNLRNSVLLSQNKVQES
jgi:monoterpene epsilon-lactone hydrolase